LLLFLPPQFDIRKQGFPAITGIGREVADIARDVGLFIKVGGGDDTLTFDLELETADAVEIHHLTLSEMIKQEL